MLRGLEDEFQYRQKNRQRTEADCKDRGPLVTSLIVDGLAVTAAESRMYCALQKRQRVVTSSVFRMSAFKFWRRTAGLAGIKRRSMTKCPGHLIRRRDILHSINLDLELARRLHIHERSGNVCA